MQLIQETNQAYMKKLLIPFFLFFSLLSHAQISLGINGAVLIPIKGSKPGYPRPNTGAKLGLEALIPIYKGLSLRTGIDYLEYSFDQKYLFSPFANTLPLIPFKVRVGYLGIPLGIRYNLGNRKLSPFAEASISFSHKIMDQKKEGVIDGDYFKANDTQISPAFAVGIRYKPTSHFYTSLQVGYAGQLLPTYDYPYNANDGRSYNSLSIGLSLGYSFGK